MRHLDLFSGIGGFALAARWMGWHTVGFCEKDPYCQQVLQKNFPHTPIYDDVRTIPYIGRIGIITGGIPCQPFSNAGRKEGKKDHRYLWTPMLRVIKSEKPAFVLIENVVGFIHLALDEVLSDLDSENYSAQSFVLPACSVDAPHKRDRIWIVACEERSMDKPISFRRTEACEEVERGQAELFDESGVESSLLADTHKGHKQPIEAIQAGRRTVESGSKDQHSGWGSEPRIRRTLNGVSSRVDRRKRIERLKCLGNAIVPQVAFQIYQAINKFNNQ